MVDCAGGRRGGRRGNGDGPHLRPHGPRPCCRVVVVALVAAERRDRGWRGGRGVAPICHVCPGTAPTGALVVRGLHLGRGTRPVRDPGSRRGVAPRPPSLSSGGSRGPCRTRPDRQPTVGRSPVPDLHRLRRARQHVPTRVPRRPERRGPTLPLAARIPRVVWHRAGGSPRLLDHARGRDVAPRRTGSAERGLIGHNSGRCRGHPDSWPPRPSAEAAPCVTDQVLGATPAEAAAAGRLPRSAFGLRPPAARGRTSAGAWHPRGLRPAAGTRPAPPSSHPRAGCQRAVAWSPGTPRSGPPPPKCKTTQVTLHPPFLRTGGRATRAHHSSHCRAREGAAALRRAPLGRLRVDEVGGPVEQVGGFRPCGGQSRGTCRTGGRVSSVWRTKSRDLSNRWAGFVRVADEVKGKADLGSTFRATSYAAPRQVPGGRPLGGRSRRRAGPSGSAASPQGPGPPRPRGGRRPINHTPPRSEPRPSPPNTRSSSNTRYRWSTPPPAHDTPPPPPGP
jgi:hypothetical protein